MLVTVTINVDTFRLADYFYRNGSVREAIVARATEVAKQSDPGSFQAARAELDLLQLPIGWLNGHGPISDLDTARQRLTWVNFKQLLTFIP